MALDTFNPYLFVSAGEQSNKFLTPTYADGIAKFQAQRAQSLTGLTVRIDPIQEGSGDPSPTNIRPISGRTGMTVTVQSGETQNEYPVAWETEAGTVYGGTLDAVSGVLTVDTKYVAFTGSESVRYESGTQRFVISNVVQGKRVTSGADASLMCSHYKPAKDPVISGGTDYTIALYRELADAFIIDTRFTSADEIKAYFAAQATAGTPVQICYYLATPQTYRLTGAEVKTLAGFNQVYSDAGPVIDIKF